MKLQRLVSSKNALAVLITIMLRSGVLADSQDERIWLDSKINGKSARLCFDSGADNLILFRPGAQRLGLKITEAATNTVLAPGEVPRGVTEECSFTFGPTTGRVRFDVVDMLAHRRIDLDGVVGWWCVRSNVIQIDGEARRITFLPKVPKAATHWVQLGVVRDGGFLMLDLPRETGTNGILCIDTGSTRGIDLPPWRWRLWKQSHPRQPTTLHAFITPADGLVVREEALAKDLAFGPLLLTAAPIAEATPAEVALVGPSYEGDLGLGALKRVDLIVDGKSGIAYLRAKSTPPLATKHNRLGAVFIPQGTNADHLLARVAEGSPAQEAGICDGDILLTIDGKTVTSTNYDGARHFTMSPGTRISFTLVRNGQTFSTTATLRDILVLPPGRP